MKWKVFHKMRIAIVQDELVRKGGAERVVLLFKKAFPSAPIYTLAYNKELTFPEFSNYQIIQSWFGKFVRNEKWLKRLFYPFAIWAMRRLDLKNYDIVLISSTHVGKYVRVSKTCKVFNYCHTPFRLAWLSESYIEYSNSKKLKRFVFDLLIKRLQKIDFKYAQRTNYFLTNSIISRDRIEMIYKPQREIEIINPPVNCNQFYISDEKLHFLMVSRLENYKKVDIVIEAFNSLGLPLIIIGNGSQKERLEKMADSNVIFKSNLSQDELSEYYATSKALIFPQFEDYGITPLEANASGVPVIAYGAGGVKETMIPYKDNAKTATSLFFLEQTKEAIIEAINKFETLEFDSEFIRTHALTFSEDAFINQLRSYVKHNSY